MTRYSTTLLLILAAVALGGCEGDSTVINEAAPPVLPGACSPAPIPEAIVIDITPGDGLGNVSAIDSTTGSTHWVWTLPGCSPDRSTRQTFTALCSAGDDAILNWRLEVSNNVCTSFTSGSTPIS